MPKKYFTPALQLPVPVEFIERRIYLIRGQKVMLDAGLAELYQVPTKVFNQAVLRNLARFPADFMFQLSEKEYDSLRSQFVTSNEGRGGRRYLPYAFTEHGVAMLSSVLNSDRAVQMNILIIRTFIKLREFLASYKDLARKVKQLEAAQHRIRLTQQEHALILAGVAKDIARIKNPPQTRAIGFVYRGPKKK